MKATLNNQKHGYRDYDITDCGTIYRACVPFNIKKGGIFNVYKGESTKVGCVWTGDLANSLAALIDGGLFPDMAPRLLPMGSIVKTIYGEGKILVPKKLGYHRVKVPSTTGGFLIVECTDKDILKVLQLGKM